MRTIRHRISAKHKALLRQHTMEKNSIQEKKALKAAIQFANRVEKLFSNEFPCLGRLIKASKVISIFAKANDIPEDEVAETAEAQQQAQTIQNTPELSDGYNVLAHQETAPAPDVYLPKAAVAPLASAVAAATDSDVNFSLVSAQKGIPLNSFSDESNASANLDATDLSASAVNDTAANASTDDATNDAANDAAANSATLNAIDTALSSEQDAFDADAEVDDEDIDDYEIPRRPVSNDQANYYSEDGHIVLKRTIPDFKNSLLAMFQFVNSTPSDKKAIYA